jgi:hypothetical protein
MVNGRDKRRAKARERRAKFIERHGQLCMNGCGKPGPHFVPPSMGESGFYTCKTLEVK